MKKAEESNLYAGLDVGTSGCKLVIYNCNGEPVFESSHAYSETGVAGHRELDPEEVKKGVFKVLCEAGRQKLNGKLCTLAVASLGESIVCLDKNEKILSNSLVTGDSRGIDELKGLLERIDPMDIFSITGLPPNELYGLPKYIWLNDHTNAIRDAENIFMYEDFIIYELTGERYISHSLAARSLAFDIRKKKWSEDLLDFAGINVNKLSKPVEPFSIIGNLKKEVVEITGLDPDIKVVSGGHDQTCAAIGSGLKNRETSECGMGTCEFMFMMMPRAQTTKYMMDHDFTCIPYVLPDTYLTSLEITTCGILKNWAKKTILRALDIEAIENKSDFYTWVEKMICKDTEVMVLPQFGSSGNPDMSMDAKGSITGLTIHTEPYEIYLAIIEGFALQMRYAYEKLTPTGVAIKNIIATGGGSKSDITLQIRADVFNTRVTALESKESGALGCAISGAVAIGDFEGLKSAMDKMIHIKKEYLPRRDRIEYYEEKYQKYKKFYEKMHSL